MTFYTVKQLNCEPQLVYVTYQPPRLKKYCPVSMVLRFVKTILVVFKYYRRGTRRFDF